MKIEIYLYSANNDFDESIFAKVDHIFLLARFNGDLEKSDKENVFLLLCMRALKLRNNLSFGITTELFSPMTTSIVRNDDATDFIVSDSIVSLIIAQAVRNHNLLPVLREVLSNGGNDFRLVYAEQFIQLETEISVSLIVASVIQKKGIFIGIKIKNLNKEWEIIYNPEHERKFTFHSGDRLIILTK